MMQHLDTTSGGNSKVSIVCRVGRAEMGSLPTPVFVRRQTNGYPVGGEYPLSHSLVFNSRFQTCAFLPIGMHPRTIVRSNVLVLLFNYLRVFHSLALVWWRKC